MAAKLSFTNITQGRFVGPRLSSYNMCISRLNGVVTHGDVMIAVQGTLLLHQGGHGARGRRRSGGGAGGRVPHSGLHHGGGGADPGVHGGSWSPVPT